MLLHIDDAAQALLQHDLSFLDTLANVGMSWWVSGIVFCATILAGCWIKREVVIKIPYFHLFCFTLAVFYSSVVVFGIFMAIQARRLELEVRALSAIEPGASFQTVYYGYFIGTTSFLLIAFCWFGLWRILYRERMITLARERLVRPAIPEDIELDAV